MPQAIKYEDTTVSAVQSATQIMGLIVKYGGERTSIEWDGFGNPRAISFSLRDPKLGSVPVYLEAKTENVAKIILKKKPWTTRSRGTRAEYEQKVLDQAHRIVWRHMKDLIEQQLLAVEIGQHELVDVFMHGLEIRGVGGMRTFGDWVKGNAAQLAAVTGNRLQLASGGNDE